MEKREKLTGRCSFNFYWGIRSLPVINFFEIVYELAAELQDICRTS